MKKLTLCAGLLIGISLSSLYSCKKKQVFDAKLPPKTLIRDNPIPSGVTGVTTTPLFEDDFDGTSYDNTKWFPRTGNRFDNQSVNLEANISTSSGILAIKFKNDQGQANTYSCGGLISRKPMGYGYYEARVALFTGSAGLHQSFWSYGAGGFPETSSMINNDLMPRLNSTLELDGFEADSRDGIAEANNHSYIPINIHPGGYNLGTYTSWFIAGYEWLPDRVNFYINGQYKHTRYFTGDYNLFAQQNLWLTALFVPTRTSNSIQSWYDFGGHQTLTDPSAKMQIDWVKYYPSTATGINWIGNSSFEYNKGNNTTPEKDLQNPVGWIETQTIAGYNKDASRVENVATANTAHTGNYILRHDGTSDYLTTTKQIISYIPNGTYKLTAWIKSSAHTVASRMGVLGFGGTDLSLNIPITNTWQQITIDNITVSNNQAVVAFTSTANGGEWIVVDDVKFENK